MASFEIAPSTRVWLELHNFSTVNHTAGTGRGGRWNRSASIGYTDETLLQFDMSSYSGYTVNSVDFKWVSGTQGSQTINMNGQIMEQDKTAPGSWSSPPIFSDFAQTAWGTALTNTQSMLNTGTYTFTGNSTFVTLVQSWIDTPSTNWGIIAHLDFQALGWYLSLDSTSRLVVDMDAPSTKWYRYLNRQRRK